MNSIVDSMLTSAYNFSAYHESATHLGFSFMPNVFLKIMIICMWIHLALVNNACSTLTDTYLSNPFIKFFGHYHFAQPVKTSQNQSKSVKTSQNQSKSVETSQNQSLPGKLNRFLAKGVNGLIQIGTHSIKSFKRGQPVKKVN